MLTRLTGRLVRIGGKIDLRGLFDASTVQAQAQLVSPIASSTDRKPLSATVRVFPGTGRCRCRSGSTGCGSSISCIRQPGVGLAGVPADTGHRAAAVPRALAAVEARHESLRTRYLTEDAGHQQVGPARPVELRGVLVRRRPGRPVRRAVRTRLRPGQWAPVARHAGPVARPGPRPADDRAPHRVGRLVHRRTRTGDPGVVAADTRGARRLPLPVQYADFAFWQRAQLTEDVMAGELGYWRPGWPVLPLDLPTDRARPGGTRAGGVAVTLPAALTAAVVDLAGRRDDSVHDAARRLRDAVRPVQRPVGVAIGTPLAGRHRTEFTMSSASSSIRLRCPATCPATPPSPGRWTGSGRAACRPGASRSRSSDWSTSWSRTGICPEPRSIRSRSTCSSAT